ncbi:MAG: mandelate racemase/muconate lactonizing enzyme family protein [Gammaproteobacteria bacterium]|nr:mandelate racemase/muconate lactonizing enzyme family protein [Gammaproteobacteria bacterium]MDH3537393.1 mandelate racemase/muconate lactonizing enzyme family protein [Gammaproteobacteria bacterium]
MRISELHVYQKDLPIVGGPYTMSRTSLDCVDTTIVKMVSDSGIVGWGEVAPIGPVYQPQHALGARAAISELAPNLIGQSALAPLLLRRHMDALLNGHNYAKAAVDVALMDMIGKHHGLRVCDLLGGAETERLPGYYATGIGSPDDISRLADEKVAEGYTRIQVKAGGRDVAIDIAVVKKVWEKIGGKAQVVVDTNRGMTASQALRLSLACSDIPFVFEQPCNTLEEVASIRGQVVHPIIIDENTETLNDVLRAISMGVCDGFGLKMTRLGGPNAMATVRDICAARSMPHTVEDTWGGDIVAAAVLHIGATVEPHLLEAVWTAGSYIEENYDPENGINIKGGYFDLPKGPGLGINPDETRIGKLIASFA